MRPILTMTLTPPRQGANACGVGGQTVASACRRESPFPTAEAICLHVAAGPPRSSDTNGMDAEIEGREETTFGCGIKRRDFEDDE